MRKLLMSAILVLSIVHAESSVYGNGDGYSSSSVGKKNRNSIISLKQQIAQLKEELEGLQSVVEGLGATINQNKRASRGNGSGVNQSIIKELTRKVNKINRNYVSKNELKKSLKSGKMVSIKRDTKPIRQIPIDENRVSNADKMVAVDDTKESKEISLSQRYSQAVRDVKKKNYTSAKKNFLILKSKKYKKASTYYYLGEISYRAKDYADAVEYYKVSASAKEDASYMDTLLLHTAISLEKQGDMSQAKMFFNAIMDSYPKSNSAKVAKKHL